ncbi:unnamed protein product [Effrenium voratum]|nr:unnamed protein product [Effrenium voratum]
MVPDTEQDLGHWALALPTYMHFTSPIRRYADVLVHRRLAVLLGFDGPGQSHEDFLNSLKAAVETCNVKKRAAQDAQMEEIQIAISDYVQRSGGVDVDDAVLTKILVPRQKEVQEAPKGQLSFRQRLTKRALKEAVEIYVPLAQSARSLSLEVLNLELAAAPPEPEPESTSMGGGEKGEAKDKYREVQSLRVRIRGSAQEVQLQKLQRLSVRLTAQDTDGESRSSLWTIRLPWAEAEAPAAAPVAAPLELPEPREALAR